ncbi:unnamed protein product [Eruca vesicaria subsp. sativa]|uniref:Uncharacterized protein n=1 Tax=Eruca vesicaria subsp. sativa TaxID=29727 RepID=A0ABC8IR64_ERUVS|nr:unnamed protein product [Eruca vesicaria subsp. sativa]
MEENLHFTHCYLDVPPTHQSGVEPSHVKPSDVDPPTDKDGDGMEKNTDTIHGSPHQSSEDDMNSTNQDVDDLANNQDTIHSSPEKTTQEQNSDGDQEVDDIDHDTEDVHNSKLCQMFVLVPHQHYVADQVIFTNPLDVKYMVLMLHTLIYPFLVCILDCGLCAPSASVTYNKPE